jgi:hypothetical protein
MWCTRVLKILPTWTLLRQPHSTFLESMQGQSKLLESCNFFNWSFLLKKIFWGDISSSLRWGNCPRIGVYGTYFILRQTSQLFSMILLASRATLIIAISISCNVGRATYCRIVIKSIEWYDHKNSKSLHGSCTSKRRGIRHTLVLIRALNS